MLHFEAGSARATVDPDRGGRLAALEVGGRNVLVGEGSDPMRWGSYPMVPFAGRIRRGCFTFGGAEHRLPINLAPHAIHGYGYTSLWSVVDEQTIEYRFAAPWPYAGSVRQRFDLGADRLRIVMTALAEEAQPLVLGWHPWFRRDIGGGNMLELSFGSGRMYELDDEGIPTGALVHPTPGPWDDCFTDLEADPVLRWGTELEVHLASTADHWVVFTEPEHAVCVEPQTDAPDAVNRGRTRVEAGECLEIEFTISW